jgi:hypothetical protein
MADRIGCDLAGSFSLGDMNDIDNNSIATTRETQNSIATVLPLALLVLVDLPVPVDGGVSSPSS